MQKYSNKGVFAFAELLVALEAQVVRREEHWEAWLLNVLAALALANVDLNWPFFW